MHSFTKFEDIDIKHTLIVDKIKKSDASLVLSSSFDGTM
jgi:hypothetical protein